MTHRIIQKELIIIGGGPAGLKASEIAESMEIDYVTLEKGRVGQAWRNLRHNMLMLSPSLPQRDWTSLSLKFPIWKLDVQRPYCRAYEFAEYLEKFCDFFSLKVREQEEVTAVEHDGSYYNVKTSHGNEYRAPVLIVGTGILGNPFIPDIPGVKDNPFVMHSYFYTDRNALKGKRVLVVGAGNSAAEVAIDLVAYSLVYLVSRHDLRFFSETNKLYHIRGVYESYLKELIRMEIIRYRAFHEVLAIDRNVAIFDKDTIEADKIIFATGYRGNLAVLKNFHLRVNRKNYPEITEIGESIQFPNLFFIGPLAFYGMASNLIHGFLRQIPKTMERIQRELIKMG